MRASFIATSTDRATKPGALSIIAAVSRRRDLPKGPREPWAVRQFRSLETAMRFERRRAA